MDQHNHYLPPQISSDPYQRPQQQWNNNNNYSANGQFQYQQQNQWPGPPPPPPPPQQPPQYNHHPGYPPPQPQPYPTQHPQEWGGGNWSQHQSWQYPNNPNEEDWAAKARAWAAGNASTDNQQPQSQFVPAPRPEGQHYFHNQFSQPVEQYPVEMGPPNGSGPVQSHYPGAGQSSYVADMHPSYAANGGNSVALFPQHDKSSISPSGRQQEVPSSYSSIKGNDAISNYEGFNNSSYRPDLQHHVQPQPQPQLHHNHLLGSQPTETGGDPSDQPLNFAPHFNPNMDPHAAQPNFTHSSGGPVVDHADISSNYAWPPSSAAGAYYPPVATDISNSGHVDHPTMFSTGPAFQPTFGVGSGITPHAMNFSGDAYGMPDRPKKASVPNWLREEIIKNKAVITGSAVEMSKVNSESVDDDNIDNTFSKRDLTERRSIDSSRSSDDEDEEEVEAARNAAINQEIKRVLTEVLLKVTDELFDEIATKVLNEDDLSIEVGNDTDLSNDQVLPPTQATVTPKASAKILVPTKNKIVDAGEASENSVSGSAGNVLGLASYASDEEDDDEIQNSTSNQMQSSSDKDLRNLPILQNGSSKEVTAEQSRDLAKLNDTGGYKESASNDLHQKFDISKSNKSVNEMPAEKVEKTVESSDAVRSENTYSNTSHVEYRPDKNGGYEMKKSTSLKDPTRSESVKERAEKKGDEENRRKEERHARGEKTEYHNGSKDKRKEKDRIDEKTKESESRKRHSPAEGTDGAAHTVRDKRSKHKDEKKREKSGDGKKERSRHDTVSDSSRHKRHRSPSVGRRDRDSKKKSASGHANDHSDDSSDDSKRRSRSSRRHKSPSPVRHRKRQVSRSPHSKHSKRRHSPYSSLETTRGKRSESRSRSRSPARRRR